MKLSTQPYKGTRDFYPDDMRIQRYILDVWKQVAERYGYQEYLAPAIEPTELFAAKSGDELIEEQSYRFTDRGGRDVMLRPEMTPSVARMVAGQRQELAYPARWYSIANFWRYERPQKGRAREFWQLNVDLFGVGTIDGDLEQITMANDIMKAFGAQKDMYTIKINSRKLVTLIMADYLGLDTIQSQLMMKLFDRRTKMPGESFESEAEQIFEPAASKEGLKRLQALLSATSMGQLPGSLRDSEAVKEVQILFTLLKENGVSNAVFDVGLMRGLDYYTDIVFEVYDTDTENPRSIFGGGRYDGLVGLFGAEPVPTVGFAVGDVTLREFLFSKKLIPEQTSRTDVYVIPVGNVLRQAQGLAGILRTEGVNTAVALGSDKIDRQIRAAVKQQIPYALFVGEEELAEERFNLKNLQTETEEKLSIERIVTTVKDERSRL